MNKPLRIGIVCYPSIGGSGILATSLGKKLAARGHEVHLISYQLPVRLNLESHPGLFFHAVTVGNYSLFKYPDYTLPLSVKIAEVSTKYNLDLVHVHYAVPHATAALLARKMLDDKCPVIVTTLHGTDTTLLGNDLNYRPVIKYSIEASDGVTTVSKKLREQTIEAFSIRHPIEVIYNFYDPVPALRSRASVRKSLGVGDDEVLLLHMSNLRPVKRVPDMLRAFSGMRELKRARLLILAGGDFAQYEPLARELGLGDRLIVHSDIADVADFLGASDLGIYPSETESFGLSILESLLYGKPVVATDTGGIPEVVTNGHSGLLCPVGDIDGLRDALDRLAAEPELRRQLGENGRVDSLERFSSEKIVPQYELYYRKLLSEKSR